MKELKCYIAFWGCLIVGSVDVTSGNWLGWLFYGLAVVYAALGRRLQVKGERSGFWARVWDR